VRIRISLLLGLFLLYGCTINYLQDKRNNCGQVIVAYLAKVDVREVERYLKTDGVTTTNQLIVALNNFGVKHNGWYTYKNNLPETGIVLLQITDKKFHWVLYSKGWYWDPSFPIKYKSPVSHILLYIKITT
jgi:hypothetical protein